MATVCLKGLSYNEASIVDDEWVINSITSDT